MSRGERFAIQGVTLPRRGRAIVGFKLFHTMGDSERATRQIDIEMNGIVDAMYLAMGVDPSIIRKKYTLEEAAKLPKEDLNTWKDHVLAAKAKAMQSPFWGFWNEVVSPIYDDWMKFRRDEEFYNLFTSWEEYEKWLERARQLRETVKAKGIKVQTPAPLDLTKTLPGAAADAAADAAKSLMAIAKWALIGGLGIAGALGVALVVKESRK